MSTEPADGTPENPYRISAPPDILSIIPHTLGFEPENSLVLMGLCGGRLGGILRLDLPPGGTVKSAPGSAYAANACRFMAADPAADGALLALYTDASWADPAHPPYRTLIRRIEKAFGAAGIPLQDGWLIGRHTWRNYFCPRPECCPWPGTPKQQIADSMLNTELIYRGSVVSDSLESAVGNGFPGPWGNRDQVAAAQARFSARVDGRWNEREQFRGTLMLWAQASAGAAGAGTAKPAAGPRLPAGTPLRGDAELAGFLLASLSDRSVRDTLLVLGAAGLPAALAGAEANGMMIRQVHVPVFPARSPASDVQDGAAAGTAPLPRRPGPHSAAAGHFRNILVGTSSAAPDWVLLDRMHAVISELVPVAHGDPKAALLSLLAWIEWARGRGSRSDVYLQHALLAAPGYRLALLLRELLGTGVLPDWARSREGSWPGGTDTARERPA